MLALLGKIVAAKLVVKVAAVSVFSTISLLLASASSAASDSHIVALAAVASSIATIGTLIVLIWNTHNQRAMVKSQATISDNVNLGNLATNVAVDKIGEVHDVAQETVRNTHTDNGLSLGQLADRGEGLRIQADVPHDERTSSEQARVDDLTEPGALKTFNAQMTDADRADEAKEIADRHSTKET